MRRQSSALVTAANKTSAIGVLFDVDYDVIVKKPCFQRGSTLKFLKNFRTLFFSNFRATPWSDNFSLNCLNQSETGPSSGGKSIFLHVYTIFLLFVLKACDQINAGRRECAYHVARLSRNSKNACLQNITQVYW